ncbi:unnamed protein product [Gongylonema pulchrum]|uniref:VWFA domain-containing protein n=1 Tax=Gongylonema pulchrum TaxID=637853 RepID=A0A183EBV1_9BILA|nr:unnamed protein product [Gongylonema pulchrum]
MEVLASELACNVSNSNALDTFNSKVSLNGVAQASPNQIVQKLTGQDECSKAAVDNIDSTSEKVLTVFVDGKRNYEPKRNSNRTTVLSRLQAASSSMASMDSRLFYTSQRDTRISLVAQQLSDVSRDVRLIISRVHRIVAEVEKTFNDERIIFDIADKSSQTEETDATDGSPLASGSASRNSSTEPLGGVEVEQPEDYEFIEESPVTSMKPERQGNGILHKNWQIRRVEPGKWENIIVCCF